MNARPIPFTMAMILSLLDGRKGQTRRIVTPQPHLSPHHEPVCAESRGGRRWVFMTHTDRPDYGWATGGVLCPYGEVGDYLWVKENWAQRRDLDHLNGTQLYESGVRTAWYWADGPSKCCNTGCAGAAGRVRTARFMPRWASRLTLRITNIRVERLQDISEADAIAEGIEHNPALDPVGPCKWRVYTQPHTGTDSPVYSYQTLWESINGAESWVANPFVWCLSFSVIKANVDDVLKREAA